MVGCGTGGQSPVAGEDVPELPADQVVYGLDHNVTAQGVRQAMLRSDSAYLYEDSTAVHLFGVNLRVFDPQGRERAHVRSTTGVMDTRTQGMIARGGVVVITGNGERRIETEEIHYDPEADRIWSDLPTVIREGGRVIRGRGFTSDTEFRNVHIREGSAEGLRIEF